MYVDANNLRRIARHLNIHHQTVANWVKDHAEILPNHPMPKDIETAELDEVFSFIGNKKQTLHLDVGRQANQMFSGVQSGLAAQEASHSEIC